MTCPKCNSTTSRFTFKLIPTNRPDVSHMPKFVPQVKETCKNGHFQKFASQTPELVEKLNEKLEHVVVK